MSMKLSDVFNTSEFNINNPKVQDIFSKTKDVAETVSRRGAEGIDVSRKKLELLDTKAKLSKAYEKYGKLQYKAAVGGEADKIELDEVAGEIAVLIDRRDVLSAELDEAKASFNAAIQKTRESLKKDDAPQKVEVEVTEAKDPEE